MLLIAALALVIPTGGAAIAGQADSGKPAAQAQAQQDKGEKGEACPEQSPRGRNGDRTPPPPGCGQTDNKGGQPDCETNPRHPSCENPPPCPDNSGNPGGQQPCGPPDCEANPNHPSCEEPEEEICNNNVDDDGDGKIDAEDTDCPAVDEICNNNLDDDRDGKVDSADEDCQTPAENCTNGVDDDGDGKIDAEDTDCPAVDEICNNNLDDDRDGKVDSADEDCPGAKAGNCPEGDLRVLVDIDPLVYLCLAGDQVAVGDDAECPEGSPGELIGSEQTEQLYLCLVLGDTPDGSDEPVVEVTLGPASIPPSE